MRDPLVTARATLDTVKKSQGYWVQDSPKAKAAGALAEARRWAREIPGHLRAGDLQRAREAAHRAIATATEGAKVAKGETAIKLADFTFFDGVMLGKTALLELAAL